MELSSKAFIVHDNSGRIIAVGRAVTGIRGKVGVKPSKEGHSVIEVELDHRQASMSVADLHKSHRVDVASKKLVQK